MNRSVKFVAEISPVREVSLVGAADLTFWKERLRRENLSPAEVDGQAQLLICGTSARFRGIGFQELSCSVFVSQQEGAAVLDGAFLTQAFNSNWIFAAVERMWFSTPYDYARIDVDSAVPASIWVRQRGAVVFGAAMAEPPGTERRAIRCGHEGWEGPIFLPGRRASPGGKWFYGRLGGLTSVYPFLEGCDEFFVRSQPALPALSWLGESHFIPRQWILRDSAVHAKSKTYLRESLDVLRPLQPSVLAAEA